VALGEGAGGWSFAYLGGLVAQLAPLIVVGYVTALYSADIRYGMNRARLRSEIDPLTGLYNLRGFAIALDRFFAHSARHRSPLSLLVLDVDNLKAVNDANGSAAGDRLVRHVAGCIGKELRHNDLAARLGDDEFVALLPETPPAGALEVAERIRAAAAAPIEVEGRSVASGVSVGVGSYAEDGGTMDAVLERAERAMRLAKEQGRNRVVRLAL
jgi:diguanylate cyclase (GGDEF)-like protein